MKHTNKAVLAVMIVAIVSGLINSFPLAKANKYLDRIVSSIKNNDFIKASGQYGGQVVTISVPPLTTNHLPVITGTCPIGQNLTFTIRKGNTNIVSEVINQVCSVSPYSLTPTIVLPDGKYRATVKIAAVLPPSCNVIVGTIGNDTLNGTSGNDCIYGNGADDTLAGGTGNDVIYSGSPANINSVGFVIMNGDGGNDTIYGGGGFNIINGTNDMLFGVGEVDILNGNVGFVSDTAGSGADYFYLGSDQRSYYLGTRDSDRADIYNFACSTDIIQLAGFPSDYLVTYASNIASLYYVNVDGQIDLIAKIHGVAQDSLNLNDGCFNYGIAV